MYRLFHPPKQTRLLISLQSSRCLTVHPASQSVASLLMASVDHHLEMSDKSALDANKGSVGQAFTEDGSVGGTAQKVGKTIWL